MRWQPFDDSVTLRATWGEGFREPSLFELHVSPLETFIPVVDPKTRLLVSDIPTVIRSNPSLAPEDSRDFTAGVVYTPKFLRGMTASVDFFDIERKDVVGAPATEAILAREAAGKLLPGEEVDRDAEGNLTRIVGSYINNGPQKARGLDFSLAYQMSTVLGTFTSLTQATWLESFRFADSRDSPQLELRSQPIGNLSSDAYLKWKGRSRFDWNWRGIDVSTTVNYIDGFHELDRRGLEHWVSQTWLFDLQASYAFRFENPDQNPIAADAKQSVASSTANYGLPVWKRVLNGTTMKIGCNNLFDHDPPHAFSITGYPDFIYDSVGRFLYVSLTKKF
jgi:outer membrane receptor protein involved in Fe transport